MRGVEVGVRDGLNSGELITSLPVGKLFLVDNFPAYDDEARLYSEQDQKGEYAKLIRFVTGSKENSEKTILINKSSMEAYDMFLNWIPSPYLFDFVYIDADHSLEKINEDLRWWNLVRNGGVLGGHDYGEHWGRFVKEGVDEFVAREGHKLVVLDKSRGGVEWAIFKGNE